MASSVIKKDYIIETKTFNIVGDDSFSYKEQRLNISKNGYKAIGLQGFAMASHNLSYAMLSAQITNTSDDTSTYFAFYKRDNTAWSSSSTLEVTLSIMYEKN